MGLKSERHDILNGLLTVFSLGCALLFIGKIEQFLSRRSGFHLFDLMQFFSSVFELQCSRLYSLFLFDSIART